MPSKPRVAIGSRGCASLEVQNRGVGGDKQLSDDNLPWTEGGGGPLKNQGGHKVALKKGSGVRVLWLGPPIHRGGPEVGLKERTDTE